jgi:hypothetical protein
MPSCQRKKRESVFGTEQKPMLQCISKERNFSIVEGLIKLHLIILLTGATGVSKD